MSSATIHEPETVEEKENRTSSYDAKEDLEGAQAGTVTSNTPPDDTAGDDPPDGGLKAWMSVAGG